MSDSAPPPPPPPEPTGPTGPPGAGGPPPGQYSNQPPASHGATSSDQMRAAFESAHKFDLAIMGIGVLVFLLSLFPGYYTVSIDAGLGFSGSDSASAWHGFFGWFGALLALAAAGVLIASMLKVVMPFPVRLTVLALFAASLVCVILALFIFPGGGCQGVKVCEDAVNTGHGFTYWLSLLLVAGGTALAFMRKDATD